MKVLITGNSGYIGSHLTKLLMSLDIEVHGLDIEKPKIEPHRFYQYDIREKFSITDQYDAVVHLAALVKVNESVKNPLAYYETNIIGTGNVCKYIPCDNFIFASTGAAENPSSPYAYSKISGEHIVREHYKKDSTIFRFYNVIGTEGFAPTNPDGLMYNLIKAIDTKEFTIYGYDYNTSDGTCVRDYVHVMEICSAIESALRTKSSNDLENLGHGKGHTVKEIVETFMKVNNVEFEVRYADRRPGDPASSVLGQVSSYMPTLYTFEELLKVC